MKAPGLTPGEFRDLRLTLWLSQSEMAYLGGVSRSGVCQFERRVGKSSISSATALRIARTAVRSVASRAANGREMLEGFGIDEEGE